MRARTVEPTLVEPLYRSSGAGRWGLSADAFADVIDASVAHAFAGRSPASDDLRKYLSSLHLDDLALAAACAAGQDAAWEHFVREHRPGLYRAADAIDPAGGARELADAMYGELFGLEERDGTRLSLFRYFHGRSRLGTWLRAVLAQRHVDRIRSTRRLDPLPEDESPSAIPARRDDVDPERPRLVAAVEDALAKAIAALAPRDRLRLSCYYVQGMKLAAIGRMLGEHEASASRHLARTRGDVREAVETRLRLNGFDADVIRRGLELMMEDPGGLNLADLVASPAAASRPAGIVHK